MELDVELPSRYAAGKQLPSQRHYPEDDNDS
jgi:hypothetical protein